MKLPLAEILNNTVNKYKTTVAAIKTFQQLDKNPSIMSKDEQKNKIAVVALKYVIDGKVKMIETQDSEEGS
jgi:DNA-directed RNA polymerase subunit K/omega